MRKSHNRLRVGREMVWWLWWGSAKGDWSWWLKSSCRRLTTALHPNVPIWSVKPPQKLSASGGFHRYIFSPQVKPDRQQLLLIDRPLSLSSKNTATTKAQIRSGSIACNRQYAANRSFCCCCRSATGPWACARWRSCAGLFLPVSNEFPSLSHQRNHCWVWFW